MTDLNFLYEVFKVKLIDKDPLKNELHQLMTGYYDLKNKYNDLKRGSVEGYRDMRSNYDSVITSIEEYDKILCSIVENHETELKQKDKELATQKHSGELKKLVADYKVVINSKEKEIASLNDTIKGLNDDKVRKPVNLSRQKVNTGDLFRLIPKTRGTKHKRKKKKVAVNPYSFQCEFTECSKTGVDTIKHNICSRWICESCHDIPARKLKPNFNKCKTLYFVCSTCDNVEKTDTEYSTDTASPSSESKFEKLILDKLQSIEMRIEATISKKLAENYTKFDAKISKASESYADSIKQNLKPIEQVPDFKKINEDTKNEELVLQKECEVSALNIIIQGLPEEADTSEGIEENIKVNP